MVAIIRTRVYRSPHRSPTSEAPWGVFTGLDKSLGLLTRADHGTDHSIYTSVQDLHEVRRIIPGDARERDSRRRRDGLQHSDGRLVVDDPVLHVDGEGV